MPKLTFRASLDLAIDYVSFNPDRYLCPIAAGKKFPPCIKDNLDGASNDSAQLEEWAQKFPGCNWAVVHRKSNLMVIDVDVKPGKGGQETFDDLDMLYGFPKTEKTVTPSGGFHLIYQGWEVPGNGPESHPSHIMALGKAGFGQGIDSPNYTLIAGCQFTDDTSYVCEIASPTAKAPQWFYDFLAARKKERNTAAGEAAVELDKPENVTWAKQFLAEDAEPAIEGKNGDMQTVKIAMGLRDRGISQGLAFELMRDIYNERCNPPWEPDELEKKVANGFRYANQSRIGDRTAEADFEDDNDDESVSSIETEIPEEKLEEQRKERKARKGQFQDFVYVGCEFDRIMSRSDPAKIWKRGGFDAHFKNQQTGKGKVSETLLGKKTGGLDRFTGIVYRPGEGENVDGAFNIYRPSNIVPAKGDTRFWRDHLEYLFPDETERGHVLNWLSWFVQNLGKKPKHALLIQGHEQGTGKSFIADMIAKIIGERNRAMITESDLTSDFNGYAMRAKLLVIEELRSVERNQVRARLHDMITQDTVSVNEKNMPRFDMRNVFGFIMTTNADAAISLDKTDRRYLVVNTNVPKKEPAYYEKLYGMLKDPDAVAAVAYELLSRSIKGYSGAGPAPITKAKEAMILAGSSELERFIIEHKDEWPFNARLATLEDIVDGIPPQIASKTGRLRAQVATAMRDHLAAELIAQPRLSTGVRPRIFALNGSAVAKLPDARDKIAELYESDKRKQKIEAEKEFDDDLTGDGGTE